MDQKTRYTVAATNSAMCNVPGLNPDKVYSLDIYIEAGKVPTVDIVMFLDNDTAMNATAVMSRYELDENSYQSLGRTDINSKHD